MSQGGKQTDISPGIIARVVQGARYALTGAKPEAWFGPLQPLVPMAPESVEGRKFDYPVGINLDSRPRGYEPIGFGELRFMADNCDVLRSVIETRKDQMESMDWVIRPRFDGTKNAAATDDQKKRIDQVTTFLQSPDRVNSWSQWQRQLLEDRFVIDAAALYKRRDRKGRLYALEIIDGATLKLLLDDSGRRPLPPDPAYQQILKGVPAVDYTADEIVYLMRNPRSWKIYGYSEVEQIVITVNIAIRRALHQLEYYREGSQPDAFMGLPMGWTPDQIKAFQTHFDSMMSGNLAARRRLKFMPDFKYQETKQPPLKDEYDEWLARIVCFAFSISPQPFIKQMNRATASTAHDTAIQEGLQPLQRWVKNSIDPVIALEFGSPDLEFTWQDDREQDPMQADQIIVNDVKAGLMSIDEGREAKGLNPIGGACAIPMALTANGYVVIDPQERAAMAPPPPTPFGQEAGDGKDQKNIPGNDNEAASGSAKKPKTAKESKQTDEREPATNAKKAAYTRLRKAAAPKPIPFDRRATRTARKSLTPKVAKVLKATGKDVAHQVRDKLGKMAKDAADDEANRKRARSIADGLDLSGLTALTDVVPDNLEGVLADSGHLALAQLGVGDRSELVDQVNDRAVSFARDRAAEMIGKRYNADGELVDSPNAQWRIDEATRDELQDVIGQGLADNIGTDAIAENIAKAGAFSEDRAELIAHTEVARANSLGSLNGYKAAREAGVKVQKEWLPDNDPCEDCQTNADAGPIDLDDEFPTGDDAPGAHPRCECSLGPVVTDDNGDENEEDEE